MTEFISVPAIVLIVYLLAEAYKWLVNGNERWLQLLPVLCGFCGGGLGLLVYILLPGIIPADNLLTAAVTGIVSGFSATGANQIYKQYLKGRVATDEYDDSTEGGV